MNERDKQPQGSSDKTLLNIFGLVLMMFGLTACNENANTNKPVTPSAPTNSAPQTPATPTAQPGQQTIPLDQQVTMEVAKAVMVTVELDFGKGKVPSIADALKLVERQYKPDDGQGRTFSILDAYGEPTPDGKLHMSMHVSSEKPGLAKMIFKKNGEVLWNAKINSTSLPPPQKALRVILETAPGNGYNVDVSKADTVPVLDSPIQGMPGKLVKDIWLDGTEHEVTFVYSACGCPVKAMVKRVGDKTVRTKDLPVMFPDDPEAYRVISKLMRWS
jgi:hypothetical protein